MATKFSGLFFWRKKKAPTNSEKAEALIQVFIKYIPEVRRIMREQISAESTGATLGRLYDFHANFDDQVVGVQPSFDEQGNLEEDARTEATPVSVVGELDTVPVPATVHDLDDKIALFRRKTALLSNRYAKDQISGFIQCLKNRKKYAEHHAFYSSFPNTTDEKIEALLGKYKLSMCSSDLYVPTFPKAAIDVMEKYMAETLEVSGKSPVFYVIAQEESFQKKFKKLDPILLVQSPFGFYWQILGAWDVEMLLLSEL